MGYYEDFGYNMIFVNGIVLSVGWLTRKYLPSKNARQCTGSILALIIAFSFNYRHAVFLLVSSALTVIWMKLSKHRKTAHVTYMVCALLMSLRILYSYFDGTSTVVKSMHMYCTFRCCSVIYEMWDQNGHNKQLDNHNCAPRRLNLQPTVLDVLCYVNFAPGLSIGPFYTFQTYMDYLNTSPKSLRQEIPYKKQALQKLSNVFLLSFIFWVTNAYLLKIIGVNFTNFKDRSFVRRLLCIFFSDTQMSCFLYIWWRAGECNCITWGIGGYNVYAQPGKGPIQRTNEISKPTKWNYNTISNGDGDLWFLKKTMPDAINSWNVTVQWWLVRYCYTQPFIKNKPRYIRIAFTQFINVIWHGGGTNFWITLMSVVMMVYLDRFAEDGISRYFLTTAGKRIAAICKYVSFQILLFPFLVFSCCQSFDLIKSLFIFTLPEIIFYVFVINFIPCLVELSLRNLKR